MVDTGTILVGVIVPLVIGPLSVFFKSLWDRYHKSRETSRQNRYQTKIKELEDKINLFYWPVYLKLRTLDRLDYKSCYPCNFADNKFNLEMNKYQSPISDHSSDNEDYLFKKKRKKKKCLQCGKINQTPHLGNICYKCKIKSESDNDNVKISIEEPLNWDNSDLNLKRKPTIKRIKMYDDSDTNDSDTENTKNVSIDRKFLEQLDTKILKLGLEIKKLVENNISIVQPSQKLIREIVRFTRYIEIKDIISESKKNNQAHYNYQIAEMGVVNNTGIFCHYIKSDLDRFMKEYQETFDNFNSINTQQCCYN